MYGLPPPHSFGGETAQKIHNWLRIRQWCYAEIRRTDEDPPILLTAVHWRIALEGRYHAIDYPKTGHILPRSSPALIARLPPPPSAPSTSRPAEGSSVSTVLGKHARTASDKTDAPVDRGSGWRSDLKRARRVAQRVDICVRFGVTGRFAPYRPEQMVKWRGQTFARKRIDGDQALWREVTWDLMVALFRFEMVWLDLEVMREVYLGNYERQRERDITRI
ncbi:hypothetical protein BV25DRAFT_1922658, partial [Artomyces pyxidatus]